MNRSCCSQQREPPLIPFHFLFQTRLQSCPDCSDTFKCQKWGQNQRLALVLTQNVGIDILLDFALANTRNLIGQSTGGKWCLSAPMCMSNEGSHGYPRTCPCFDFRQWVEEAERWVRAVLSAPCTPPRCLPRPPAPLVLGLEVKRGLPERGGGSHVG